MEDEVQVMDNAKATESKPTDVWADLAAAPTVERANADATALSMSSGARSVGESIAITNPYPREVGQSLATASPQPRELGKLAPAAAKDEDIGLLTLQTDKLIGTQLTPVSTMSWAIDVMADRLHKQRIAEAAAEKREYELAAGPPRPAPKGTEEPDVSKLMLGTDQLDKDLDDKLTRLSRTRWQGIPNREAPGIDTMGGVHTARPEWKGVPNREAPELTPLMEFR